MVSRERISETIRDTDGKRSISMWIDYASTMCFFGAKNDGTWSLKKCGFHVKSSTDLPLIEPCFGGGGGPGR